MSKMRAKPLIASILFMFFLCTITSMFIKHAQPWLLLVIASGIIVLGIIWYRIVDSQVGVVRYIIPKNIKRSPLDTVSEPPLDQEYIDLKDARCNHCNKRYCSCKERLNGEWETRLPIQIRKG